MSEFQPPDGLNTEEAAELANVLPPTLEKAYAEGRKDADEETVAMLKDELAHAEAMARGNAGNPRYDYYADCIRMLIENFPKVAP